VITRNLLLVITCIAGLAVGVVAPLPLLQPAVGAEQGRTGLISYAPGRLPTGMPGTYDLAWAAGRPDISADGARVAFATNVGLVPNDTNRITDIYLFDRPSHRHILASPTPDRRGAAGVALDSAVVASRISADGRLVVFCSSYPAFVAADPALRSAVFLFDSAGGEVWTIAREYDDAAPGVDLGAPDVADAGGRILVVFASAAPTHVAGDGNGRADVFVHDLASGSTARVSTSGEGGDADGASTHPVISADGRWVAFVSSASNLVAGDHNGRPDIFLHDLRDGATARISLGPAGAEADGASQWPAIDGDGARVVFRSAAANLVPGDTNGVADAFVYDRATAAVSLLSTGVDGPPSGGWEDPGSGPAISDDGRFVSFSAAIPEGGRASPAALFVRDLALGTTTRLLLTSGGSPAVGAAAIADGGRLVAFAAGAQLSPMLVNQARGVFLHDRDAAPSAPGARILAVTPAQVLQTPLGELSLQGRAVLSAAGQSGASAGYAWLSSLDGLVSQAPVAEVAATLLSPGRHALTLVVIDGDGEAAASAPRELTVVAAPGRQLRTLILANPSRLRALYPGDPQLGVLERRLLALAAHQRVDGLLLDVSGDPLTAEAYRAWDRAPTTERANQLAALIKAQIDRVWRRSPLLEYLVIVGDDRVIPFRRVPDTFPGQFPELYTEAQYADQISLLEETTVGRALLDNQVLTDDYYARSPARPRFGSEPAPRYYVPALGTGRLVEEPAEILGVVEAFLERDRVVVTHGAVSADACGLTADLAAREYQLMTHLGLAVDCTTASEPWSAELFREHLLGGEAHNEVLTIQIHASHLWFGASGEYIYARDLAAARADLARALIISTGCHAGLNVPPSEGYPSIDLPQAALSRQANFLGGTAYSVVCRDDIRWSEALVALFERLLLGAAEPTPGRALVAAKRYYQRATFFSYDALADEKASLQLTFYGLPMYRYVVVSGPRPPPSDALRPGA
jgi:Tol biopolymer transport system component